MLEVCGYLQLGDLNLRDERELLKLKNCGRKTVRELRELLRRAAAGEFSPENSEDLTTCLHLVIHAIDAGIVGAPLRNRKIFDQRLVGKDGYPRTLEDVGIDFHMTRERVRQIVKKMMEQIRQAGGPRLARALEIVARECEQRVCPLTPAVCRHWLGERVTNLERDPEFYVRVLDVMAPEIPAWASGPTREGADHQVIEPIIAELETWLQQHAGKPAAQEALESLRAQTRFHDLSAGTFLTALRRARQIKVDFPEPERATIRLRRLRITDFAKAVLTGSTEPLTPEEIVDRARKKFGADAIVVTARSAGNSLTAEQGFYLLGPRALGLRQHFRATDAVLTELRDEFAKLLENENRPLSTIEAIDAARIDVPAIVNSYELAQVLREDTRFIDLGRRLFALTDWGIQERQHIKDLLPKVFAEARHALTVEQALKRLTRLRSASPSGLSNILRHHPEIQAFGFGYYGLKRWGDVETEVMLRDRAVIERAVRRFEYPITFGALCELLRVDPTSARGKLVWKTSTGSKKLCRAPDRFGPDTLLLHKTVSFELALSTIMRALGRPVPAYELQWELAANTGALRANRTRKDRGEAYP